MEFRTVGAEGGGRGDEPLLQISRANPHKNLRRTVACVDTSLERTWTSLGKILARDVVDDVSHPRVVRTGADVTLKWSSGQVVPSCLSSFSSPKAFDGKKGPLLLSVHRERYREKVEYTAKAMISFSFGVHVRPLLIAFSYLMMCSSLLFEFLLAPSHPK